MKILEKLFYISCPINIKSLRLKNLKINNPKYVFDINITTPILRKKKKQTLETCKYNYIFIK